MPLEGLVKQIAGLRFQSSRVCRPQRGLSIRLPSKFPAAAATFGLWEPQHQNKQLYLFLEVWCFVSLAVLPTPGTT